MHDLGKNGGGAMKMKPTCVRLSDEVEKKLEVLSRGTGRSKSYFLRRIVESNIDEFLEYHRLDSVVKEYKKGNARIYTQSDLDPEFDG